MSYFYIIIVATQLYNLAQNFDNIPDNNLRFGDGPLTFLLSPSSLPTIHSGYS